MTRFPTRTPILATVLLLAGCGDSGADADAPSGSVTATLDGTTYTVPANCREYEGEINVFSADASGQVEIAARQMGDKLNLDVFIGEDDYSTPNLGDWQRTDNGVSGSGKLFLDDAENYREYPVTFEADCG